MKNTGLERRRLGDSPVVNEPTAAGGGVKGGERTAATRRLASAACRHADRADVAMGIVATAVGESRHSFL